MSSCYLPIINLGFSAGFDKLISWVDNMPFQTSVWGGKTETIIKALLSAIT